jgi:hypothetical protein
MVFSGYRFTNTVLGAPESRKPNTPPSGRAVQGSASLRKSDPYSKLIDHAIIS